MFTFEPGVAFWTIITFSIAMWIMQSKVYPPVRALLDTRRETIARNLQEAEQKNQSAELVSKELTEKLQTIRIEEQRILSEAREKANVLYEQYVKEAQSDIRELRQQKEQDLGKMETAFFEKSEQKLTSLIVTSCEKILKTGLTPEQQQTVITKRIEELTRVKEL